MILTTKAAISSSARSVPGSVRFWRARPSRSRSGDRRHVGSSDTTSAAASAPMSLTAAGSGAAPFTESVRQPNGSSLSAQAASSLTGKLRHRGCSWNDNALKRTGLMVPTGAKSGRGRDQVPRVGRWASQSPRAVSSGPGKAGTGSGGMPRGRHRPLVLRYSPRDRPRASEDGMKTIQNQRRSRASGRPRLHPVGCYAREDRNPGLSRH